MKAKELKNMNETNAREAIEAEFTRLFRVRNISTEIGRVKLIAELRNLWRASGHVGDAACYAALGGIEAEIARETCEELML